MFMKGCTFNAQLGPRSSMKSKGVCFHGRKATSPASIRIDSTVIVILNLIGVRTSEGLFIQQRLVMIEHITMENAESSIVVTVKC